MPDTPIVLRVATYNASLYSDQAGGLISRLEAGSPQAQKIAAVLQHVRPDLVLLNEFDYDPAHRAADLFQRHYLETPQSGGGDLLDYPYRYLAPVNTGIPSGLKLSHHTASSKTSQTANNAWGFGSHPGQYGMLVLSKFPIELDTARSFQFLKWSAMPGAYNPVDPRTAQPWYSQEAWPQLRLSSKSHWDLPIRTPRGVVHFLVAHPTPPVFDGPENRNGQRNALEIRLWQHYLDNAKGATWLCDDAGRCGGLESDAKFVLAGDLNNDPVDGDGHHQAIDELIHHPRMLRHPAPISEGGAETTRAYANGGLIHHGPPDQVTGDFGRQTGTLRLDYVLPSVGFEYVSGGVFWPASSDRLAKIADGSDHHLVWADLKL